MRWRALVVVTAVMPILLSFTAVAVFCNATLHVHRKLPDSSESADIGGRLGAVRDMMVRARDGATLRAWFVESKLRTTRCVVILHGIADSRTGSAGFAPMFLERGYSVLIPDARAHGSSGGDLVTYGLLESHDLLNWADRLKASGCTRIYGLGESLGAASLIQACSLAPVFRAAVAEGSYADLRSIAEYRTQQLLGHSGAIPSFAAHSIVSASIVFARLRYGLDFDRASPREAILRSQTPILLIHGLTDDRTPPSHSIAIHAANPRGALWLVPGAGHTAAAAAAPEEFRRRVLGWFDDH